MGMPDPVPQVVTPAKPYYESEKVVKSHLLLGLFSVGSLLLMGAAGVGMYCSAGTTVTIDDARSGVLIVSGLIGLVSMIATIIAIYNGATDTTSAVAGAIRTFHLVGASTVGSLLLLATVGVTMFCVMTPRGDIDNGRSAALVLPGIAGLAIIIATLISQSNGYFRQGAGAGVWTRQIQTLHIPGLFTVGIVLVAATAVVAMICVANPSVSLVGWRSGALVLSGLSGIATVVVTLIASYNGALDS
jgi:hypothetical protein